MQELCLNLDPDYFYCPVTGHLILGIEDDFSPSPAMLFLYLHEVQEFEYVHESVSKSFPQYFAPGGEIKNSEELYKSILESNYMNENERILVNFGQISMASMGFDFNFQPIRTNDELSLV
jgi:hypothetical protein